MREYKFRCWDTENKEMLKVQELDFEDTFYSGRLSIRTDKYNDYFDMEDMVLMQYTVLKDKNGKEIYEGDIVKSYFENGLGAENKCLIIYDEYLCAFMGQELRTKQQYLFNEGNPNKKDKQLKYTEVIGNIYDNPELLREGE